MTRTEVREHLGVSLARIRALTDRGKLAGVVDQQGKWIYDRATVESFVHVRAQTTPPQGSAPPAARSRQDDEREMRRWEGLMAQLESDAARLDAEERTRRDARRAARWQALGLSA